MQTAAARSGGAGSLPEEARAMQHRPSLRPVPSIRIEYSTARATRKYSPAKPPPEVARIGKALEKAAKHLGLKGVALSPNADIRSIIRKATRAETTVGAADNIARLFFNLGILIRVLEDADSESMVLFDAERMQRFASGEGIPSTPSEEQLIRRASELIASASERNGARSSSTRVKAKLEIEDVVLALVEASGEMELSGGGSIPDLLRDPLGALRARFPETSEDALAAWVERAMFDGYLEDFGEGVWRVQIDRPTPVPSSGTLSIEAAIERARLEQEQIKEQLEAAKRTRKEERRAVEEALREAADRFREEARSRIMREYQEAVSRVRSEKTSREQGRIQEAQREFDATVDRIRREEADRGRHDLDDAEVDRDARLERVPSETEVFRSREAAEFEARSRQRDGDVFGPLNARLRSIQEDLRRLTRIRDQTS